MESHVSHRQRLWLYILTGLTLFYLVVPSLIVLPLSLSGANSLKFPPDSFSWRWYEVYFGKSEWQDATLVSLQVAFGTMLIATPAGVAAAYGLHLGRFRYGAVLYGSILASLMVPVILIAIALYFLYARLDMVNTVGGLILADTLLAIPFVLVTVAAGLKGYDMSQEMVARSLGASRLKAFLTVTLPQIKTSVIAGAFFAFIVAFDEVVIALFLSNGEGATLTKRMFSTLRDEVDPTIAAVSSLLILLTTLPPLILQIVQNRKKRG